MMEKLLRKSWGVLVIAVMFATVVSAQDLALLEQNAANSENQLGKSTQTNTENFQEKKVTGRVVSGDNDEGLPGVNVIVRGTTTGGITDVEGRYSVNVPGDDATLIFSSVGYITEEITVGNQSVIDVILAPDITALDEIIVIGYGTAKKKDLTGAIVNVKAETVEKYKPTSVSEILRTTVPGLVVGYSTSAKNVPGFDIRGDNSIKADNSDERAANKPLIVVDGVIFQGDLSEINPNDVESVDVLKDASAAAIYGSQATNGVVIFTTKKGELGKPKISFSSRVGLVTGAKRVETFKGGDEVLDWLTDMNESINGLLQEPWTKYRDYYDTPIEYQDQWLVANGVPGETNPTVINGARVDNFIFWENERENFDNGITYDWQDFLFHTGVRQDYDLSVSGRSEKVSYYYSLGYSDRESVQVGETFKNISSRLNLDVSLAEFLDIGVNANFVYQNDGQQSIGSGGYRTASPYDQPWRNGQEQIRENLNDQSAGSNRSNPYQDPSWNTRHYDQFSINPTVYTKVRLPAGFSFRMDFTPRFASQKRFDYDDKGHPEISLSQAQRRHRETFSWQWNNILSWDKEFGNHRFSVTGLYNAEKNQRWETLAAANNFSPTDALGYHGLAFGLNPSIPFEDDKDDDDPTNVDEVTSRTAIMGRINYAFSDRYNFSASIRQDGYSRFGSENLYANFPSISGAWTITNENFMASGPNWLNHLKLRVSWGVNGNSSGLDTYNAYAQLSNNLFLNYDGGYFAAPYTEITRIANPLLSWEKSEAFNLGIDFGLWNDRLGGSFDVYRSETKDLLLDQKLPDLTGLPSAKTNIGNLENTGFDLGLNSINISTQSFLWSSTFNVTYRQNKITTLGNDPIPVTDAEGNPILDGSGNIVTAEPDDLQNGWFIGENKDVIWDYELDGVYQLGEETEAAQFGLFPGDFRIIDQDGDGNLDVDDKTFLGVDRNPWYITFRNDMEWKGFDFGLVFLAKVGYKDDTNYPFNNRQEYIKNHNWFKMPFWTPDNPINDFARINSIAFGNDAYISKSYLRIQNVSVGYSLPGNVLEKMKFDRVRFAFNIENAAVWSEWSTFNLGDPESEREMPRTYSFSLDFTF